MALGVPEKKGATGFLKAFFSGERPPGEQAPGAVPGLLQGEAGVESYAMGEEEEDSSCGCACGCRG